MSTETPEMHSARRRWPWLLLILILIVAGASQVYRLAMRSQVRHELAALRQAGFPAGARELQASLPVISDLENAAIRIMEAADYLALDSQDLKEDQWPRGAEELGPDERDTLRDILTDNAPALEAVHLAAELKQSRFPVDYSQGFNALLPHLAKIRSLSRLLRAETVLHSEEGRPDLALKSVLSSVALARSLDQEPLLISQLVRISCLATSCSALERLLNQHALSEAQLRTLTAAFRGARDASGPAYQRGYVGETCLGIYCFTSSPTELLRALDENAEASPWAHASFPLYAWTGLRDRDFLFYLKSMRQFIAACAAPFPESLNLAAEAGNQSEREIQTRKLLFFSRMLLPALGRSMEKAAESEARLRSAEAALAVELYRARNQAVPKSLSELDDELAGGALRDPFDGEPLRYQPRQPGYLIYSLGPDGTDEGGVERARRGGSGVRRLPPQSDSEESPPRRASQGNAGRAYDIPFVVER